MKVYRDLAEKTPSFRERSETTDLIVDITLQPWRAFQPDGVILFSDILTPLPAIGIPFEIDDYKGPLLDKTIRSEEDPSPMTKRPGAAWQIPATLIARVAGPRV